ncbi:hypothetical protein A8950_3491 [Dongia mobilis]|uniref:Uncharacterized protein n=1 Tax=Dongia mobilis TaxID=578943 RepID=A0A4V3DDV7_9PROT|nr:hypothetical protein [Dongia mobilis]TDQ78441.1 hypothetical protein A8950_3491 [Dongia mobilis]
MKTQTLASLVFFLLATPAALSQELTQAGSLVVLTSQAIQRGAGYDTELRITQPSCVQGTLAEPIGTTSMAGVIQSQTTSVYAVSTKVEMIRRMSGGHSVSWGELLKFTNSDVSEFSINEYDANVVIEVNITMGSRSIEDVNIKPAWEKRLNQGPEGQSAFRRACGNQFVWTEFYEGRVLAVLSFSTRSKDHRTKTENEVIAGLNKLNIHLPNVSTESSDDLRKILSTSQMRYFVVVQGGTRPIVQVNSIQEMFSAFQEAVETMVSSPRIGRVELRPYTIAQNYPDTKNPVALYDTQTKNRDRASRRYQEIDQAIASILFILSHPNQFAEHDRIELTEALKEMQAVANAYYDYLAGDTNCLQDVLKCGPLPADIAAIPDLPQRLESSLAGCEVRRSNACGPELYVEAVTNACPIATYITRADPQCVGPDGSDPQPIYQYARGPECGVELHKSGECLILNPNYRNTNQYGEPLHNVACKPGTINIVPYSRDPNDFNSINTFLAECTRIADGVHFKHRAPFAQYEQSACRHPDFGVELYTNCRSPMHPVESWPVCSKPEWGGATFQSCRSEKHGVELFKECNVRVGANGADTVCVAE